MNDLGCWGAAAWLMAASIPTAHANEVDAGVYQVGRVVISAPGWREVDLPGAPEHFALLLETGQSQEDRVRCRLTRASGPQRPDVTQQDEFPARIAFVQSLDEIEIWSATLVDDVAVVSAAGYATTNQGGERQYAHGRFFLVVQPNGMGLVHTLACWVVGAPSEANRARVDAVANSLRFSR